MWNCDLGKNDKFVVWLVEKQLEEIKDNNCNYETIKKEFADIVLIILQYFLDKKENVDEIIKKRIEQNRAKDKATVFAKYGTKWRNENGMGI